MTNSPDVSRETGGPGGSDVIIGTTVPSPSPQNLKASKLIVAVHGVGDQLRYSTLQAVVNQFCQYYGEPAGIPLGAFHNRQSTFSASERKRLEGIAFAEVYWAAIPRRVTEQKYTLEEAKMWATTIIERLRARSRSGGDANSDCRTEDFQLSAQVVHEMIESIAITERLCFVAEKAGLFTFDLRRILDDYLGDVQIVTEFKTHREKILRAFRHVLTRAHEQCPNAEIYIISHSEGTVVSFLALLEAFRSDNQPPWASQVRGFMTLGSPIDKHLFFWPELFGRAAPVFVPRRRILWRNYYDYGDPIGFDLKAAREWLSAPPAQPSPITWNQVFEFRHENDLGFTRYPFPGKAHVDYWRDRDVFTHFIETVVESGDVDDAVDDSKNRLDVQTSGTTRERRIPSKAKSWATSWILPYVAILTLFFIAGFILTKSVLVATLPAGVVTNFLVAKYGVAMMLLLTGVTVAARVPRLTGSLPWRTLAWVVAIGCGVLFMLLMPLTEGNRDSTLIAGFPVGSTRLIVASLIVLIASVLGVVRPDWGARPMIVMGAVALAGLIGYVNLHQTEDLSATRGAAAQRLQGPVAPRTPEPSQPPAGNTAQSSSDNRQQAGEAASQDTAPVWPIAVAGAVSLYLWWLGTLMFDLVVVWHLYIRSSLINRRLREMTGAVEQKSASNIETITS
jgi:hypothetical protein